MAGIHRGIGEEYRGLRIFIEPTDNNGTMIKFINEWGDVIRIDYLLIMDEHGEVKLKLEGEDIPTSLRYMIPGGEVALKPSDIGLQPEYDDDYWKMKREISQIRVHTETYSQALWETSKRNLPNTYGNHLDLHQQHNYHDDDYYNQLDNDNRYNDYNHLGVIETPRTPDKGAGMG